MTDQNEGKLIRINDSSELKVGMACKLINCKNCRIYSHVFNITDKEFVKNGTRYVSLDSEDTEPYTDFKFKVLPDLPHLNRGILWRTFTFAIPEGRLFAIVDENPIQDEIVVTKRIDKPAKVK